MDFSSPTLLWFAAAACSLGFEIIAPIGTFLFVAFGAFAAFAATLLGASASVQLAVFAAGIFISFVFLRKRLSGLFSGKSRKDSDIASCPLTDAQGVMREDASGTQEGSIEVGGSFWRAISFDGSVIAKGERVRVKGSRPEDPTLLLVEKLHP